MNLRGFPKVWNLGHPSIKELFKGPVDIEEKVDGSQFSFGVFEGELFCRSRGKQINIDAPEKLFNTAIKVIKEKQSILHPNYIYRGEYLRKPKHNTLEYSRVPKDNIIIFDISTMEGEYFPREFVEKESMRIGLECVPLIKSNVIVSSLKEFEIIIDSTYSILGDVKIEGLVFKSRDRFGVDGKPLMGKFVSEKFKEKHNKEWKKSNPSTKDIIYTICGDYTSEARYEKTVQHLREEGLLQDSEKDIGLIFKEFNLDFVTECKEEIKERLWKWSKGQILRRCSSGIPEWYKAKLRENQFID